jgi:hypothetical protein
MNIEKIATWAVIILVGAVALVALLSKAETPLGGVVWDDEIFQQDVDIKGALDVDGNVTLGGTLDLAGQLNYVEAYNEAGTSTLTAADSGTTYAITGAGPVYTLPATTSADGLVYRFVVAGSVSANATIVTSDGGNNIEGALIVAGAVVDCDAEDTLTFVADGENIGDFVELRLVNGYWMIGASGALTESKLTCTAS